jgi:hypothetical protein
MPPSRVCALDTREKRPLQKQASPVAAQIISSKAGK